MKQMVYKIPIILLSVAVFSITLFGCSQSVPNAPKQTEIDYTSAENWAYLEVDKQAEADVFFVCPTVYGGDENASNMPMNDTESRKSFLGATNMEKGIYDANTRFFAPYYRQAGLWAYTQTNFELEESLDKAYDDVKAAFQTYLDNYGEDNPIILAGFSQGADMAIRLLKDFFDDDQLQSRLVACYAIGWRLTDQDLQQFPHLKLAQAETDVGVIVSFNTEDPAVTDSLIVPEGTKTFGINPLNWRTDDEMADKTLNLGACFTNYSGEIEQEISQLTGAYLDTERGTLKVTDIAVNDYPPSLDLFSKGVYHLYDYQFFYRNLQQNVTVRLESYINSQNADNAA